MKEWRAEKESLKGALVGIKAPSRRTKTYKERLRGIALYASRFPQ